MNMEPNIKLGAIVIVTLSALFNLFNPVESECVPLVNSYVAKSLIPVFPPANGESPVPTPVPSPEIPVPTPAPTPEIPAPTPSRKEFPGSVQAPAPSQSVPVVQPPSKPSGSPGNILDPIKQLSPEIKNLCAKTDFPPLCESSILPLLSNLTRPDPESVLILEIQASIDQTKTVLSTIGEVAADCQEFYDSALTNLEDSITAIKSHDTDTTNTNLSAAMTDYSTCNDTYEETGEPNPLADVGDKLMKMASNCLAIATLIK